MNSRAVLCAVVLCSGCSGPHEPPRGGSVKEFQEYYSGTKWCWSEVTALPATIPGYQPMDFQRGAQVHLVSEDEKRSVRYTEMEHGGGIKAFRGLGALQKVEGVEAPLFAIADKTNTFIGFFEGRLFRIEVVNWGEDPTQVKRDVVNLGLQVLGAEQKRHGQHGIEPAGAANGSQPIRPETNSTSSAAGSRR